MPIRSGRGKPFSFAGA